MNDLKTNEPTTLNGNVNQYTRPPLLGMNGITIGESAMAGVIPGVKESSPHEESSATPLQEFGAPVRNDTEKLHAAYAASRARNDSSKFNDLLQQKGGELLGKQPEIMAPKILLAQMEQLVELRPAAKDRIPKIHLEYLLVCELSAKSGELWHRAAAELTEDNSLTAELLELRQGELQKAQEVIVEMQQKADSALVTRDTAATQYWDRVRELGFRVTEVSSAALHQEVDARTGADDELLKRLKAALQQAKEHLRSLIAPKSLPSQ